MVVTSEAVLEALAGVVEPERGKDILRLNMVKNLKVEGDAVSFTVIVQDPRTAFAREVEERCREALRQKLGREIKLRVQVDSEMISLGDDLQISGGGKAQPAELAVRNTVAVASGKGGVGKSTVAVNLAVALALQGYDVGLLDADIYGPSIPTMFGLKEQPRVNERRKIVPLEKYGVRLLSMGLLVDPAQAVVWRGPMVSSAIRQFLGDTEWGALDYLVLDMPPGTGDIQLTVVQTVSLTGAVIVSTPQTVALADARKGVVMFQNVHVPVLGLIENMAYFTPPDLPDRRYHLFGEGGARRLAEELALPFLGEVPIDQALRETGDAGTPIVAASPESAPARAFHEVARQVVRQVTRRNAEQPPTQKVEVLHR